jgi:hypothetical protein
MLLQIAEDFEFFLGGQGVSSSFACFLDLALVIRREWTWTDEIGCQK